MVSEDLLHFHQIQKDCLAKSQLTLSKATWQENVILPDSLEVVEGVDEAGEVPLAHVLLLQPGAGEPVPGVIILGARLGAHVDHELHPGGHLLLHLQRQRERLRSDKHK